MAVYSTRAEWLEAQARDHSCKLASLTVKTTDAYFMGKFAAHAFTPDLEKDAGIGGSVTMFAQNLARKFPHLAGKAGTGAGGGTASLVSKLRGSAGSVATGGARAGATAGTVVTRAAAPARAATSARTAATGVAVPSRTAATVAGKPGATLAIPTHPGGVPPTVGQRANVPLTMSKSEMGVAPTLHAGGQDDLVSRWQKSLLQNKSPAPTVNARGGVAAPAAPPTSAMGAPAPKAMTEMLPQGRLEPVGAPTSTDLEAIGRMRAAGIPEEHLQTLLQLHGGRTGPIRRSPMLVPTEGGMMRTASHKFNAVLLNIMERSMPNDMIKSAALHATLDDEGILKVASEDSYWHSARGYCHLSFLAGVYDVDPDMAWTFAKNAGIMGGVARGVGRLFGGGARTAGQAAGGVARGAGAVRGAAQTGAGAVRGAAGRAGNWWTGAGSATPGLNPFQRAAGQAGSWWKGTGPGTQMSLSGMEGPATNPFGRAGRAIAQKARTGWEGTKGEFRQGFAAGRNPAPKQMDLQFGKPEPVGRVTPAAGGAAPKAAPGQGDLFGNVAPDTNQIGKYRPASKTRTQGKVKPMSDGEQPLYATRGSELDLNVPREHGYRAAATSESQAGRVVGKGPYRQAPAPDAAAPTTAPSIGGAGSVAPPAQAPATASATAPAQPAGPGLAQRIGRGAWETTKGVGRGVRNVGIAAGIGVPLGAGLVASAAGKVLERNPAPHQYGMGTPQTWNFPQQM